MHEMNEADTGAGQPEDSQVDPQLVDEVTVAYQRLRDELSKIIIGQEEVVDQMLIALFANGHCMLEGVPGLAKTLMISSLAKCLALSFRRIQFTPDLMPSDITGTEVIQEDRTSGDRSFKFLPGPIFANVILADEINRTPPKTQAALLEAMQERHITVGGTQHDLSPPFFVLATQNPIEQEGTYPLPEAQQDRFMFKVLINYPSYQEEYTIADTTTGDVSPELSACISQSQVIAYQALIRRIPAAPEMVRYALDLVRATRPNEPGSLDFINKVVSWGAGPRAVQSLLLGAKARAVLQRRYHVAIEDIRALAAPVLRHRVVTNYSAEAEGYTTERIVEELLHCIDPNRTPFDDDECTRKVLSA